MTTPTTPDATHHVAQINVGRLVAPIDSPEVADFVELLPHVNALADAADGFIWRLQTDEGDATGVRITADPLDIVNLSVWTTLDALWAFLYRSRHLDGLRRRREWFQPHDRDVPYQAMWWIAPGTIPTVDEAMGRLDELRRHGAGPRAFTFRQPYDAAGQPLEEALR